MYLESPKEAQDFCVMLRRKARGFAGVDVFLAPPFPLIPVVAEVLSSAPMRVGAQTVSSYLDGKHTGEVSVKMLKESGASFCIVGHSERRALGETDAMVRAQLDAAVGAGLTVVLCIGEAERQADGQHFSVIEKQLSSALEKLPLWAVGKIIIAYEPVWAIGKGPEDAMKPADLQEMDIFIKKTLAELLDRRSALRIPILYGGSVDATNALTLITEGGVSGFLVGRASAQIESFLEILKAVRK
jgi:triosephosphate isomerase